MLGKFSSSYEREGGGTLRRANARQLRRLQRAIIRITGDVLRASLLRRSRNKLSGAGELLNQHLGAV